MELPRPFGRYTLLSRLGAGGMADVYLAEARGASGFEKLVSYLVHPNIAQVFDLARCEGRYYIVMEYVEGVDCFRILKKAGEREINLPVEGAARIVRDVAAALGHAHAQTDPTGKPLGLI